MKNYLLIIATSFAITQGVYSQTEKQQITDIEKASKEIKNNINKYKKTEKIKNSSGNRCIYKDDNELKLITLYFEDIDANKNVEWYFANGQLFYTKQVWTDKKTNKVIDCEKFYLYSGHLLAWTKDDKPVDTTSEEFKKVSKDLPAYGTELIAQAK